MRRSRAFAISAAALTALAFGWSTLAALGLTTFIVSLSPCAAMCALGLCAARMAKKETVQSKPATRKETS